MNPRAILAFVLLGRFVCSRPIALGIPPYSREGVRESGWRLGRLLSDYESAEASTPRSVAKTEAVPSGESKEEGRCLTQRENWKDRLGQK